MDYQETPCRASRARQEEALTLNSPLTETDPFDLNRNDSSSTPLNFAASPETFYTEHTLTPQDGKKRKRIVAAADYYSPNKKKLILDSVTGSPIPDTIKLRARAFNVAAGSISNELPSPGFRKDALSAQEARLALTHGQEYQLVREIVHVSKTENRYVPISQVHQWAKAISRKRRVRLELWYHWMERFAKRWESVLHRDKAKGLRFKRFKSENFAEIKEWFEANAELLSSIDAEHIYNMDETGVQLADSSIEMGVESKEVNARTVRFGKSEHVSVVECISAAGQLLPPFVILSKLSGTNGDRLLSCVSDVDVTNWKCVTNESGYMTGKLFNEWIQHFDKVSKPKCANQRRLLLMDNCEAHNSKWAAEYAQKNNIVLLTFPPNLTHWMQPLDASFFGQLKSALRKRVAEEQDAKFGIYISRSGWIRKYQESRLVVLGTGGSTAVKSFEKTGIYPFDINKLMNELAAMQPNDNHGEAHAFQPAEDDENGCSTPSAEGSFDISFHSQSSPSHDELMRRGENLSAIINAAETSAKDGDRDLTVKLLRILRKADKQMNKHYRARLTRTNASLAAARVNVEKYKSLLVSEVEKEILQGPYNQISQNHDEDEPMKRAILRQRGDSSPNWTISLEDLEALIAERVEGSSESVTGSE